MLESERHRRIIEFLRARKTATLGELQRLVEASQATIRRDLSALNAVGLLKRVHGGAAIDESRNVVHFDRARHHSALENEDWASVAGAAADLCEPGDRIILQAGFATAAMIPALNGKKLSILTNSFEIAARLLRTSNHSVAVTGGTIMSEGRVMLSPIGAPALPPTKIGKLFLECQGLTAMGATTLDPILAQTQLTLMNMAEEIILLASQSAFSQAGQFLVCPLQRANHLVAAVRPPRNVTNALTNAGVRVSLPAFERRITYRSLDR